MNAGVIITLILLVIACIVAIVRAKTASATDRNARESAVWEPAEKKSPQEPGDKPLAADPEPVPEKRENVRIKADKEKDDQAFWSDVIRTAEANRRRYKEAWETIQTYKMIDTVNVWCKKNEDPEGWDDEFYIHVRLDESADAMYFTIKESFPDVWDPFFICEHKGPIPYELFLECMHRLVIRKYDGLSDEKVGKISDLQAAFDSKKAQQARSGTDADKNKEKEEEHVTEYADPEWESVCQIGQVFCAADTAYVTRLYYDRKTKTYYQTGYDGRDPKQVSYDVADQIMKQSEREKM